MNDKQKQGEPMEYRNPVELVVFPPVSAVSNDSDAYRIYTPGVSIYSNQFREPPIVVPTVSEAFDSVDTVLGASCDDVPYVVLMDGCGDRDARLAVQTLKQFSFVSEHTAIVCVCTPPDRDLVTAEERQAAQETKEILERNIVSGKWILAATQKRPSPTARELGLGIDELDELYLAYRPESLCLKHGIDDRHDDICDFVDKIIVSIYVARIMTMAMELGGLQSSFYGVNEPSALFNDSGSLYGIPDLMRAVFRGIANDFVSKTELLVVDDGTFPALEPSIRTMESLTGNSSHRGEALYRYVSGGMSDGIDATPHTNATMRMVLEITEAMPLTVCGEVGKLWKSALNASGRIADSTLRWRYGLSRKPKALARFIDKIADMTGIDSMVEAYRAGVPLDDIA